MISNKIMVHKAKNLNDTHPFNPTYTSNLQTELILCSRVLFEKLTVTQLIKHLPALEGTLKLLTLFKQTLEWDTSVSGSGVPGGGGGEEFPKALQNRAKLNTIVKTVKNCWI